MHFTIRDINQVWNLSGFIQAGMYLIVPFAVQKFAHSNNLLIVLYRRLPFRSWKVGNKEMALGGGITGFLSGVAGSAGPLGAAFFLGLNISAGAYIATEGFSALVMHLIKTIVCQKYSLVGQMKLFYGLYIGLAMFLGSWTGKKVLNRLSKEKFRIVVEALFVISAIQLILFN